MRSALYAVELERQRQDQQWGEQNHPDGTSALLNAEKATYYRRLCDQAHRRGGETWADILIEEFYEALAEEDPLALRAELVQVAAVAVAWIEAIDRRMAAPPDPRAGFEMDEAA